jgi:hypothetical protein
MKKIAASKLALSATTLRRLDDASLAAAAGGRMRNGSATVDQVLKCFPTTPSAGCPSDGCSTL